MTNRSAIGVNETKYRLRDLELENVQLGSDYETARKRVIDLEMLLKKSRNET